MKYGIYYILDEKVSYNHKISENPSLIICNNKGKIKAEKMWKSVQSRNEKGDRKLTKLQE